ncbi:hypothetical protein PIB30_059725 [Stylosanthes scabra]|uniref:Uncharacterized protein n=1 Tax=Stylosanthes scabra TaxID=79078 RepID=A0ABU6ZJ20_9FABA|nr:hypothetical protein [Stylosanthes scabra]
MFSCDMVRGARRQSQHTKENMHWWLVLLDRPLADGRRWREVVGKNWHMVLLARDSAVDSERLDHKSGSRVGLCDQVCHTIDTEVNFVGIFLHVQFGHLSH